MIRSLCAIAMVLVAHAAFAQEIKLESTEQKASYAIGRNIANEVANPDVPFDVEALVAGFRDGLTGAESKLSEEQVSAALQAFQTLVQNHMQKKAEMAAKAGTEYLADNAKKEGVKTTKSGLQYEVVKPGTGATPKLTDTVVCHYKGTLIDGTEFDSSYKRGEPAQFPVNGVIEGWTEALQMMKVGGKWKLYIPANLAYGPQGRPGIPPNAVLLFDIELLDIAK
ncbi:FKBP-type 22 kDa peptidyl-prolyl cis-trans isomerase [Bremerella volcania]|uniref:Peptidyl-prolyl cis-trans isomerase n=1 Tax=Bremerella volcania TaxID=2527984 RepID=A0A518CAB2_9BACT|nr:FKBP-type peptidyl-prolyl cis-trans isomerase [Bremerella volcania]QDU76167.1 FKBP-type 22 kDa peptidyl-prolyl cis-trans isomerase [Bremerella volcania]